MCVLLYSTSTCYEEGFVNFLVDQQSYMSYIIVHPQLTSVALFGDGEASGTIDDVEALFWVAVSAAMKSYSNHMRAVPSFDPVIKCFPSNVIHTDLTSHTFPLNSRTSAPSSNDHMRAVLSSDPVMKCFPSNVVHTDLT